MLRARILPATMFNVRIPAHLSTPPLECRVKWRESVQPWARSTRDDQLQEGEYLEVLLVEGSELLDAGGLHCGSERGVEDPLAA